MCLKLFSIIKRGTNAIKIKKTIPLTGQESPKRSPVNMLNERNFLLNFFFENYKIKLTKFKIFLIINYRNSDVLLNY